MFTAYGDVMKQLEFSFVFWERPWHGYKGIKMTSDIYKILEAEGNEMAGGVFGSTDLLEAFEHGKKMEKPKQKGFVKFGEVDISDIFEKKVVPEVQMKDIKYEITKVS